HARHADRRRAARSRRPDERPRTRSPVAAPLPLPAVGLVAADLPGETARRGTPGTGRRRRLLAGKRGVGGRRADRTPRPCRPAVRLRAGVEHAGLLTPLDAPASAAARITRRPLRGATALALAARRAARLVRTGAAPPWRRERRRLAAAQPE